MLLACIEDLLDVHWLSFELVCDLGAFLHHGDYVQTTLTNLDNLMRIGELSVKHDVFGSQPCFQGFDRAIGY